MNPRNAAARRIALGLTLAAGTLAATAGAALAAPATTVTPKVGLDASAPTSVTVRGTGFVAPDVPTGIYVAQTAVVGDRVVTDTSQARWIRTFADGAFEATISVSKSISDGTTTVDCGVTQCAVSTWMQHTNPTTTTLYTSTPITFALTAPATAEVSASPTSGLSRDATTTVEVSGTGFDPNANGGNGFYVTYGPTTAEYWRSTQIGAAKRIYVGATPAAGRDVLDPDGSWRTSLDIAPTYTTRGGEMIDCRVVGCSIYTFAAQGGADRTLDTATALTYAAPGAPVIRVSPTTGLSRDTPTTVEIAGTNFDPSRNGGNGFYVTYGPNTAEYWRSAQIGSAKRIYVGATPGETRDVLNGDGSFRTTLSISPSYVTRGGETIDCRVVGCSVYTFAAQGGADRGLDTATPLTFAEPVPMTPEIAVAPKSGLSRDTPTTLEVSGTGFDPNRNNGNGFYVTYGPTAAEYWTALGTVGAAKRIFVGAVPAEGRDVLNPDGSFRTTLTFSPTYTTRGGETIDCRVVGCSLYTFAAQGGTDRGLDTATPLEFAPLPPLATVTPTEGLNPDAATTVTVRGAQYSTGTYVALTAVVDGRVLTAPQDAARWIRRGGPTPAETLNADGTFETTISVTPTFAAGTTTVDCRVTQCAVSTWRQHTLPTPEALYTTQNITFAARQVVQDPPRREPTVDPTPPRLGTGVKGVTSLARNGTATVATIVCGTEACTVTAPRSVKVKVGKKRYRVAVLAPRALASGRRGSIRVKLPKAAIRALAGRKAKIRVTYVVTTGATRARKTATVTVKGKKVAKRTARKKAATRG